MRRKRRNLILFSILVAMAVMKPGTSYILNLYGDHGPTIVVDLNMGAEPNHKMSSILYIIQTTDSDQQLMLLVNQHQIFREPCTFYEPFLELLKSSVKERHYSHSSCEEGFILDMNQNEIHPTAPNM